MSGPTVTDYLAISALVLAIVTLALDVVFYVMSTSALTRSEREQSRVFTEMREVLAHISERAQIVQEQVNSQTGRLIDVIASRASTSAEAQGDELSLQLRARIDQIDAKLARDGSVTPEALVQLRSDLESLRTRVASMPGELGEATRVSVKQLGDDELDSPFSALKAFGPALRQIVVQKILELNGEQGTFEFGSLVGAIPETAVDTAHFPMKMHHLVDTLTLNRMARTQQVGGDLRVTLTQRGVRHLRAILNDDVFESALGH